MQLSWLLFGLALLGLATSTAFLCLVLFAAVRFRRRSAATHADHPSTTLPPVTLLKPLCGLEPNLEANLESFFSQRYSRFEIIFGARDSDDPALEIVSRLARKFPEIPVKVAITGEPPRANAKVCSLIKMYGIASHDYLIISDSDVAVAPDYICETVRPLLDPAIGMVTCLYRGVPTSGAWSRLEALGMSVEMTSGVLVADLLEGMKFALGPTMAIRRDILDRIGGFGILADYCADDYVLGASVYGCGKDVVLSDHIIDHVVINRSLAASIRHQVRWARSTRFSRAWGHVGTVLTFAMPFGLLGLGAGISLHRPGLGIALFLAAFANRVLMAMAVGWITIHDRRSLWLCWLYPVRDLMGFGFWFASFFGRTIQWRGEKYRLEQGGRMVPCSTMLSVKLVQEPEVLPTPVAADR